MESLLETLDEAMRPQRPKKVTFQKFVHGRAEQQAALQTGRRKAGAGQVAKVRRVMLKDPSMRRQYRFAR
jgi:hypothetical protein